MQPLQMLCSSFKCVGYFYLNHIKLFACEKRETCVGIAVETWEKSNCFLRSVTSKVRNCPPDLEPYLPIFWVVWKGKTARGTCYPNEMI